MFLYDQNKRCIAVDDESAKALGYASSAEFLDEAKDVAQFFINRPGYVYDFRNFSWIDYIIFNPGKEHRVIIPTSLGEIDTAISVRRLKDRDGRDYYAVVLKEIDGLDVSSTFMYEEAQEGRYAQMYEEERQIAESEAPRYEEPRVAEPEAPRYEEPQEEVALYSTPAAESAEPPRSIDLIEEEGDVLLKSEPASLEQEQAFVGTEREEEELRIDLIGSEPEVALATEATKEESELHIKEEEPIISLKIEEETPKTKAPSYTLPKPDYSIEEVARELEIDEDLVRELVEEFLQQAREMEPEIYEALDAGDLQRSKDLIHKIKGAVANLRIKSADEILAQTSDVTDMGRLREIMDQFYAHLRELEAYLKDRYGIEAPEPVMAAAQEEPVQETTEEQETIKEPEEEAKEEPEIAIEEEKEEPLISLKLDEAIQEEAEQEVSLYSASQEEASLAAETPKEEALSIGAEALEESEPSLKEEEEETISLEELKEAQPQEPLEIEEALPQQPSLAQPQYFEQKVVSAPPPKPEEVEPHEAEPELDLLAEVMEQKGAVTAAKEGVKLRKIDVESMIGKAVEELGISREDVEEFVRDYIFRAINLKPLVERLVQNGSKEELRNAIHKLKGTALNLRLAPLVEALERFSEGDERALGRFYEIVDALKEGLGVEVVETLDSGVLERNALELGIDLESYREIVDEYIEQLSKAIERAEDGISSEEIHKLISVGENLRLGLITSLLEGILENGDKRHYYLRQLRELIERYKGAS